MTDLTGSNSKLLMTFPFLAVPVLLQDFSADESIVESSPDITSSTFDLNRKKYDSLTGYEAKTISIKFMATSPSLEYFTFWKNEMALAQQALNNAVLVITSYNLGKKVKYNSGALRNSPDLATIGKTLGDVTVVMSFDALSEVIKL